MIVVTCPTGAIGQQVLALLGAADVPLRVIARDPCRLPADLPARIEIVQGSHHEAEVVNMAFANADAVFWLVPPQPLASSLDAAYSGFSQAACAAIKTHKVRYVVGVSALGRGTEWAANAGLVTASLAMDDLIAGTGVNYRALTMPSFMDNILRQALSIKDTGMFFAPLEPGRKMPTCATKDIAEQATRFLLDGSWTGSAEAPILGPEDVSMTDMALIMTEVLGKPIRYQQIPFEAYKARFARFGMSEAMAQGMTDMAMAKNAGLDNAQVRTAKSTTSTSFAQWCEDVLRPVVTA